MIHGGYLFAQCRFGLLRLRAGELRRTHDRASSPTGGDHITVSHVQGENRVYTTRSVRALSQTSVGDRYCSGGRILVAGTPSRGLRGYRVGSSIVMTGSDELHLTVGIIPRVGGRRAKSNGLGLTDLA
jgi:hypothetical protein